MVRSVLSGTLPGNGRDRHLPSVGHTEPPPKRRSAGAGANEDKGQIMSRPVQLAAIIILLPAALPSEARGQEREGDGGQVVRIEMVDFAFEPAEVKVQRGDTLRFVQMTNTPHNVEFRDVPAGGVFAEPGQYSSNGTGGSSPAPQRMGPFLLTRGEVYEVVIDEHFVEGVFPYVCTPHVPMGMVGRIVVEATQRLSHPVGN